MAAAMDCASKQYIKENDPECLDELPRYGQAMIDYIDCDDDGPTKDGLKAKCDMFREKLAHVLGREYQKKQAVYAYKTNPFVKELVEKFEMRWYAKKNFKINVYDKPPMSEEEVKVFDDKAKDARIKYRTEYFNNDHSVSLMGRC